MSEGAQLPWKVQRVDVHRGPVADYACLHRPLPDPPQGLEWIQVIVAAADQGKGKDEEEDSDETRTEKTKGGPGSTQREWKLVRVSDRRTHQHQHKDKDATAAITAATTTTPATATATKTPLFVEHTVLPTDTLQGLCLKYKISMVKLRQANGFSGSNLLLAPTTLRIPVTMDAHGVVVVPHIQDVHGEDFKVHKLRLALPRLSVREARSYLAFADWDLDATLVEAKEDLKWEESQTWKGGAKRGIVGTYLDIKSGSKGGAVPAAAPVPVAAAFAETGIPLGLRDSSSLPSPSPTPLSTFTDAAMRFFHGQEGAGVEMKQQQQSLDPLLVPLLATSNGGGLS